MWAWNVVIIKINIDDGYALLYISQQMVQGWNLVACVSVLANLRT
jgi:hypothetical protein